MHQKRNYYAEIFVKLVIGRLGTFSEFSNVYFVAGTFRPQEQHVYDNWKSCRERTRGCIGRLRILFQGKYFCDLLSYDLILRIDIFDLHMSCA